MADGPYTGWEASGLVWVMDGDELGQDKMGQRRGHGDHALVQLPDPKQLLFIVFLASPSFSFQNIRQNYVQNFSITQNHI